LTGALRALIRARIVWLAAAMLVARIASAIVVGQPGYTDAYYYHDVARRLAAGQGLTADFIWNFLEAPGLAPLPVASHRFWMPLASVLQALGVAALPFLDAFRAAQAAEIAVAVCIPVVAYAAARSLRGSTRAALVAGALAGLGGAFAPAWVSLDAFAPAAIIGTLFFLAYGRAADGDARAGLAAGVLVGLLFLARAEAALFGLGLLALVVPRGSRRAGIAGTAAALAIGGAWLARDVVIGGPPDLFARSALLVRYEDFFAMSAPSVDQLGPMLFAALPAKVAALGTNAMTLAIAFFMLLVPGILRGAVRRDRADVRVFAALLVVVYLAESIVWTLHSTRGSYFHSLAAFLPFGVALGIAESEVWLRLPGRRAVAAIGAVAAAATLSVAALAQWDVAFNTPYRDRLAVLSRVPPGPLLAIDAAAWRWISDRTAVVTPADGLTPMYCAAFRYGIRTLVLEPVHFSAYEPAYRGERDDWFDGPPIVIGDTRIYRLKTSDPRVTCAGSA
jgi:hypothetical protein